MNQQADNSDAHDLLHFWLETKGRADGLIKGLRVALLDILAVRRIEIGEEALARIRACKDAEALRRWVGRAAVASSLAEVLDD